MNSVEGKVIVYYGKRGGKTTASIGHAIRALGHNKKGEIGDIATHLEKVKHYWNKTRGTTSGIEY